MNEPNRRLHTRVALSARGKVRDSDLSSSCSTLDVSLSGMALISTERRSPGKFVRIAWCLPGHAWLEADAVVVHARLQKTSGWVLGLRFLHLPRASEAAIFEYVAGHTPGLRIAAAPRQATTPPQRSPATGATRWGQGVWKILPRDADELDKLYQQALASVSNG